MIILELKNTEVIRSSEKKEAICGEGADGRLYIKKSGSVNAEAMRRLSKISSPFVARIAEFDGNSTVFEYVSGVPLSKAELPKGKMYGIFRELCDGLYALHSAGIIHRDIKPSNIILCDNGHIKIIDFDAARIKKPAAEKDTSFIGTDGFAPPEQYGFMQTDERSDIYALGVTMKLLLGESFAHSPYRGVIGKCLRFNPEQRFGSVKSVKTALALCRYRCAIVSAAAVLCIGCGLAVRLGIAEHSDMAENTLSDFTAEGTITVNATSEQPYRTDSSCEAEIPADSVRLVPWDSLMLPDNFPRLAEGASEYSCQSGQIILAWDKMSLEEAGQISAKLCKWFNAEPYYRDNDSGTFAEYYSSEEFSADVTHYSDETAGSKPQCTVSITAKQSEHTFGFNALKLSEPVEVPDESRRSASWSSLGLPQRIPCLSDGVTEFSEDDYRYILRWDRMSALEAASMAYKLSEWIDCEVAVYADNRNIQWLIDSNTVVNWYNADDFDTAVQTEVCIGK